MLHLLDKNGPHKRTSSCHWLIVGLPLKRVFGRNYNGAHPPKYEDTPHCPHPVMVGPACSCSYVPWFYLGSAFIIFQFWALSKLQLAHVHWSFRFRAILRPFRTAYYLWGKTFDSNSRQTINIMVKAIQNNYRQTVSRVIQCNLVIWLVVFRLNMQLNSSWIHLIYNIWLRMETEGRDSSFNTWWRKNKRNR